MQNYVINGVKVNFDLKSYLSTSLDILRKDMPQINMDKFYEFLPMFQQYINVEIRSYRACELLPTQNEINYSNVLVNAASRILTDDQLIFICSKDLHIIDGHHRMIECLITSPERLVTCYVFDLSIEELLDLFKKTRQILDDSVCIDGETQSSEIESSIVEMLNENFGMQGPEASVGMGDVTMPNVSQTSGEMLDTGNRGSGDIVATPSKIDWSERLKALRKRRGEDTETGKSLFGETIDGKLYEALEKHIELCGSDGEIGRLLNESMGDISPEEWENMSQMTASREAAMVAKDGESRLFTSSELKEYARKYREEHPNEDEEAYDMKNFKGDDIDENANLKLAKHFDNADGLELLTCINKPVKRKCIQIDEPFSCNTLEGITQGKAGDMLVVGLDNEIYPCDKTIFDSTYVITGELEESKE